MSKPSVLVVCLGNICRSPLGEAVLAKVAKERGIDIHVESAGTSGWHVGEEPDDRTVTICEKVGNSPSSISGQVAHVKQYNVPINHLGQKVESRHFREFDYIVASDTSNLTSLEEIKPNDATATVKLFGAWADGLAIQDPYYGGLESSFIHLQFSSLMGNTGWIREML